MKEPSADPRTETIGVEQAICTNQDQWKFTKSSPAVVVEKMKCYSTARKEERSSSGFRESLRFFQSQEVRDKPPSKCTQVIAPNYSNGFCNGNKDNLPKSQSTSVPTVDNILNNVRTICANQNSKKISPIHTKPVIHAQDDVRFASVISQCENGNTSLSTVKNNTLSSRFNPSFDSGNNIAINPALKTSYVSHVIAKDYRAVYNTQNSNTILTSRNNMQNTSTVGNLTHSSCEIEKGNAIKHSQTLLNGKTPSINIANDQKELIEVMEKIAAKRKKAEIERSRSKFCSNAFLDSEDVVSSKPKISNANGPIVCFMPIRPQAALSTGRKHAVGSAYRLMETPLNRKYDKISSRKHADRTKHFSICNGSHSLMDDSNDLKSSLNYDSQPTAHDISPKTIICDNNIVKLTNSVNSLNLRKEESSTDEFARQQPPKEKESLVERLVCSSDLISERGYDSLESDYQPQDFVVHKTTLTDDYLDITSEDAYSSINEEYEVEHPDDEENHCPNTPSPDYVSDEDEEFFVHQGISDFSEEEENNPGNNGNYNYLPDPRRYYYYPDEKELEVIPEEDEDDLDDDDKECYSQESSDQGSPDLSLTKNRVFAKENITTECDSGVPDDHSSMDDFSIEDIMTHACGPYDITVDGLSPPSPNTIGNKDYCKGYVTRNWDPSEKLLPLLYSLPFEPEFIPANENKRIYSTEGFVNMTIEDSTTLKKASRMLDLSPEICRPVYIKIERGKMHFHRNRDEEEICFIWLTGVIYKIFDGTVVKINDRKGNIFFLHFKNSQMINNLLLAISHHARLTFEHTYCNPNFRPITTFFNAVIVDIGGQSIRAGIAMSDVTLPMLYFPSTILVDLLSGQHHFGLEAFKPETYKNCEFIHPYSEPYEIMLHWDTNVLRALLKYIFSELRVEPHKFKMVLTTSRRFSDETKMETANLILSEFNMQSLCISLQSCATMAGYRVDTGLCIEMGDRSSVAPFYSGGLIHMAESVMNIGAPAILDYISLCLHKQCNKNLCSPICKFILRYVLEKLCYVSKIFERECENFLDAPEACLGSICLNQFFSNADENIDLFLSKGRFSSVEALFTPEIWGHDISPLIQRIFTVFNCIPEDCRLDICSNIFLAGGLTLCDKFVERLKYEISATAYLNAIKPTIHASRYRNHMSYFGSYEIATNDKYGRQHITAADIERHKYAAFKAWNISFLS